ncbi:hypothetical protein FHR70_004452 [Microvirga lupini]|uniref:Uncharacterized protein n=1 Tax=Microvirga lupini TaxID=420324 RepID=A0A7W4VQG7_9HYPH|nr:hypothetical protein [Microvirga lupini]
MRCSPASHSGIEMPDLNAGREDYQLGLAAQTRSSCRSCRILGFLPAALSHIIAADRQSCRLSPNACKHTRSRSEPHVRIRPQSRPLNSHAVRQGLTIPDYCREDGQRSDPGSVPEHSRLTQRSFKPIGMAPVQNLFDKTGEHREREFAQVTTRRQPYNGKDRPRPKTGQGRLHVHEGTSMCRLAALT